LNVNAPLGTTYRGPTRKRAGAGPLTTSKAKIEATRIHNPWPVAREGIPFILTGVIILCVSVLVGNAFLVVAAALLSLFVAAFFRDPERGAHASGNAILTPADGRIISIEPVGDRRSPLGEPTVKISIFMSVFNVHVNRVPVSGQISEIEYRPGRFFSAHLSKASEENECNRIALQTVTGGHVVFVQIAGLIARRIVCWVREGDDVRAGQRFGLIRFGSRVDLYLPDSAQIKVQPRQKVKAGETILGYLS
jgi:phosphatidylserine decarboxylase